MDVASHLSRHKLDRGDLDEGLDCCSEGLEILREPTIDRDPRQRGLNDPTLGLDDEAELGALGDLDRSGCGFGDARPLISSVREEALEEGEPLRDAVEDELGAV